MFIRIIETLLLLWMFCKTGESLYFSTWQPGFWNQEFFVCSQDFQIKNTVPGNNVLDCALMCATQYSCQSFNFLANESSCQIFPYKSKHFQVVTDNSCFYFFQGNANLLKNVLTNLALRQTAIQSGIYEPTYGTPSKAVDGIRSSAYIPTGCVHTLVGPPNWWAVDLRNVFNIYYVLLINRDSSADRLNQYIVGLNNTLRAQVNRWDYDLCGQYPKISTASSWYVTLCNEYPYGHRYVILQSAADTDHYLTVCEFEVRGQ